MTDEATADFLAAAAVETFQPHVGTAFRVGAGEDPTVVLTLTEAQAVSLGDVEAPGPDGPRAPFSLVFTGPAANPLAQGTYALEHRVQGRFDLFLVPVGMDETGRQYEAAFA